MVYNLLEEILGRVNNVKGFHKNNYVIKEICHTNDLVPISENMVKIIKQFFNKITQLHCVKSLCEVQVFF